MADWIDRAQQREALELERAMTVRLAAIRAPAPSLLQCIDCNDEIPAARRALGGVRRCITCQTKYEREYRT